MPDHEPPTTQHQSLRTMTLVDLLDAFASNEPVPGGGSAAALAGALGTSLLIMVAGLSKTRTGAPEEVADLAEASTRLRPLRDSLLELVDDDSRAYTAVLDAMRLPKATEVERHARRTAIDAAMGGATRVPLETMRFCQQALRGAIVVATHGNRNASSDTGTAVELLVAALRGAGMNIDVNLSGISDASALERMSGERVQLSADAEADAARARDALRRA